jgi:hypothetical protein
MSEETAVCQTPENERPPLYGWLADEHNLFHAVGRVVFKMNKEETRMVAVGKDGELTLCGMPADIMEWPGRGGPPSFCPVCAEASRPGCHEEGRAG